jgi:hypothetical protein
MTWLIVAIVCTVLYVFLRSRPAGKTNAPVGDLPGPGAYGVDIVGESKYQDSLERICGGREEESARKKVKALLVLEDENPHDNKAVRVDIDGETVGYLARREARQYRARLKEAGYPSLLGRCDAIIVGGWERGRGDRGHFGVKLDLPTGDDS